MKTQNEFLVTDIQRFCMHDGPGLRTVVFLNGCPLHCKWCHNPETQNKHSEIEFFRQKCISCHACEGVCASGAQLFSPARKLDRAACVSCGKCAAACPAGALRVSGRKMTADEIINEVKKDMAFYGEDGGITLSGGEPASYGDGLVSLLRKAKKEGLTTCIETCGVFPSSLVPSLSEYTDTFLYDIKDTDAVRLRENTGADLSLVLDNLREISRTDSKTVLRCILIPGINMNDGHVNALRDIFRSAPNAEYIELLPYHPYGSSKAAAIGKEEPLIYPVPEKNDIIAFGEKLTASGIRVKCFGSMLPGPFNGMDASDG